MPASGHAQVEGKDSIAARDSGTSTGVDMYTCEYGGMDAGTRKGTGAGASREAWMQVRVPVQICTHASMEA